VNKTNKILILSVSALCIIGTLTLLKAVFTGAEFGSVSDWVSSISTFGTLIVALIALKKAPDWINQKKHEDGYELAKKLIVYEYPELTSIISKYQNHLQIIKQKSEGDDIIIALLNADITIEDCDYMLALFNNAEVTPLNIRKSIKQLSRFNWFLKKDVNDLVNIIHSQYDSLHLQNYAICNAIKISLNSNKNINNSITTVLNSIRNNVDKIQVTIKKFEEFDVDFENYFDKSNAIIVKR